MILKPQAALREIPTKTESSHSMESWAPWAGGQPSEGSRPAANAQPATASQTVATSNVLLNTPPWEQGFGKTHSSLAALEHSIQGKSARA